jgi:hypothetical protein
MIVTAATLADVQRKFFACLAALGLVAALLDGVDGVAQLALFLGPFIALLGLVLRGRFIGERQIVRRWQRALPSHAAHPRSRWAAAPLAAPVSWLDRVVRAERGPPALAAG